MINKKSIRVLLFFSGNKQISFMLPSKQKDFLFILKYKK